MQFGEIAIPAIAGGVELGEALFGGAAAAGGEAALEGAAAGGGEALIEGAAEGGGEELAGNLVEDGAAAGDNQPAIDAFGQNAGEEPHGTLPEPIDDLFDSDAESWDNFDPRTGPSGPSGPLGPQTGLTPEYVQEASPFNGLELPPELSADGGNDLMGADDFDWNDFDQAFMQQEDDVGENIWLDGNNDLLMQDLNHDPVPLQDINNFYWT